MSRTLAPITSMADLMAFANPADDRALARLEMAWKATESEIRRFCGQNIAQPADPYVDILPNTDLFTPLDPLLTHDNTHPGGLGAYYTGPVADGHVLPLRQGLVRSITSVYVDTGGLAGTSVNDFAAATLLDSSEYFVDVDEQDPDDLLISRSGNLIRTNGVWPNRRRTVKVTYVAGLTAEELDDEFSDLRLMVVECVLGKYNSYQMVMQDRIKRERLGDWEVEYFNDSEDTFLTPSLKSTLQPFVKYSF